MGLTRTTSPPFYPQILLKTLLSFRDLRGRGGNWWTRSERTRTFGALPLEEVLLDDASVPLYQRLAAAAAALRPRGLSDHAIAVDFGVTDTMIAKAIRWLRRRPGFQAG